MKIQDPGRKRRAGFTLLEMTAVLILTAISLMFAAMLIETTVRVAISSKHAVADSQKIQVAMNRLVKELTYAEEGSVIQINSNTIQWTSSHPDRFGLTTTARWHSGATDLRLSVGGGDSIDLLDYVGDFSFSTSSNSITLTIASSRSPGIEHTTTIHPRYDL